MYTSMYESRTDSQVGEWQSKFKGTSLAQHLIKTISHEEENTIHYHHHHHRCQQELTKIVGLGLCVYSCLSSLARPLQMHKKSLFPSTFSKYASIAKNYKIETNKRPSAKRIGGKTKTVPNKSYVPT